MADTKGNRGQGANSPTRPIRIVPAKWERFGDNTKRQGTDRSEAIRRFMDWYNREPGAELPERPPAE
jgi:hypothetical protein